jgi:hypothetical protein
VIVLIGTVQHRTLTKSLNTYESVFQSHSITKTTTLSVLFHRVISPTQQEKFQMRKQRIQLFNFSEWSQMLRKILPLREWIIDSEEVTESSLSDDAREPQKEERELQNEEDNRVKTNEVQDVKYVDISLMTNPTESLSISEAKNQHRASTRHQDQEQEQQQQLLQRQMDSNENGFFIDMTVPSTPRTRVLSSFHTLRYCSFFNFRTQQLTLSNDDDISFILK